MRYLLVKAAWWMTFVISYLLALVLRAWMWLAERVILVIVSRAVGGSSLPDWWRNTHLSMLLGYMGIVAIRIDGPYRFMGASPPDWLRDARWNAMILRHEKEARMKQEGSGRLSDDVEVE